VDPGHSLAQVGAERAVQQGGQRLQDGGALAELDGTGRHLASDEPAAEHGDVPGGIDPVAQRGGIGDGPQVADAVPRQARQDTRAHAGGQQQLVVADRRAVGQRHGPGRQVEPGAVHPQQKLDLLPGVPGGILDGGAAAVCAAQELLGQRRALVRHSVLRADQGYPAAETLRAQPGDGGSAGHAAADHYDPPVTHRPMST
jgi:hypothetical protein